MHTHVDACMHTLMQMHAHERAHTLSHTCTHTAKNSFCIILIKHTNTKITVPVGE